MFGIANPALNLGLARLFPELVDVLGVLHGVLIFIFLIPGKELLLILTSVLGQRRQPAEFHFRAVRIESYGVIASDIPSATEHSCGNGDQQARAGYNRVTPSAGA